MCVCVCIVVVVAYIQITNINIEYCNVYLFIHIFMLISTYGSSMLSWAHNSVVWAVSSKLVVC